MEIRQLDKETYQGRAFTLRYQTSGYYDIDSGEDAFRMTYKRFAEPEEHSFDDKMLSDWLDDPVAFGAFEGDRLLGFAEGTPEAWNNRYRISNICVLDEADRRGGIGSALMSAILAKARESGARMAVLETQSCNERAIAFYKKHGFAIIGFDLYSYTNTDPQRHEVRIEMGRMLENKPS